MSTDAGNRFAMRLIAGFRSGPLPGPAGFRGVLWCLCAFFALGCNSEVKVDTPVDSAPFAGRTVTVLVPKGYGFGTAWDIDLHEWAARTGAEFELREAEMTDPAQDIAAAEANLVVFPLKDAGGLVATGTLVPIPDELLHETQLDWTDLFPGLREKVATTRDGPMFVPLSAPVLVCYYRDDLLRKANLAPPRTWDEYEHLVDQLDHWAPGLKVVEPWGEAYRATMFLARVLPFAKHPGHYSLFFDIDSGNPVIDGPGFVRGMEKTRAILEKLTPEVREYDPAACRREILAGRAALAIALETGAADPPLPFGPVRGSPSDKDEPPADADKNLTRAAEIAIGFTRLPGATEVYNRTLNEWEKSPEGNVNHVGLTGFAGLGIGVTSQGSPEVQSAAWNLLATLTSEETGTLFPQGTRSLTRESQLQQPGDYVGAVLGPGESAQYLDAVARTLRDRQLVVELPVPGRDEFRDSLTKHLGRWLAGETSPEDVLAAVQKDWQALVEQRGSATVREQYRKVLGLPPSSFDR